jgi:anti-sigma28 factor (negative regulator of flagellin synthesis)
MYRHGATCLAGPVSKARVWWIAPAVETETTTDMRMTAAPPAEAVSGEEIRQELVARVRREIAEGTYDSSDKWEIALARLLYRLEQ